MGRKFSYRTKLHGTGAPREVGRHWTEYQPVPSSSPVAKQKTKSPTEGQREEEDGGVSAPADLRGD